MDSVISWAILTVLLMGGLALFLLRRAAYLDSIHKTKAPCVWANAGRRKDWQAFYTGHVY